MCGCPTGRAFPQLPTPMLAGRGMWLLSAEWSVLPNGRRNRGLWEVIRIRGGPERGGSEWDARPDESPREPASPAYPPLRKDAASGLELGRAGARILGLQLPELQEVSFRGL